MRGERARLLVLRALGLPVAALVLAVGTGTSDPSAVEYVALGDSRAAAPDTEIGSGSDGCGRSGQGYPVHLARALRPHSFLDVTCAGATSANVLSADQPTTDRAGRGHRARPQISALNASTTLVTISIGGNDLRWFELISSCFPPARTVDAACRSDPEVRERIRRRLAELTDKIDADLDAIVARAPRARVVVVGHGGIYGLDGCSAATFSPLDAAWVADFFGSVDAVLRGQAHAHHALFVDVRAAAAGHEACAPVEQRWFAGNEPSGTTPVRHPTALGGRAIADLIAAALPER
ncbi:SGNH/GDSL hydrolase family protein [Nocardia takedensis]|uniref:SGNH/GDSL hydrolase family protein n=1 Tax=Nocardia takedensis TaxID=259390 RepID=UPI000684CB23|nr:SGNH/GDSL hydrolase family protein [Nocardia takedensis]